MSLWILAWVGGVGYGSFVVGGWSYSDYIVIISSTATAVGIATGTELGNIG